MPNQFQNVAFPLSHQMEDTYKPVIESKNLKNNIKIRLSVGQKQKKNFFSSAMTKILKVTYYHTK